MAATAGVGRIARRARCRRAPRAGFGLLALLAFSISGPAPAAEPLAWTSADGKHRLALNLSTRFRAEAWDAHATNTDWFTALRTRLGVRYDLVERLTAFGELQDARIHRLDDDSSGAGALYRTAAGGRGHTHGDRIRQLWLEMRPRAGLALRAGRQDIKLGTEVMYPEASWKYLKAARLSQRLVGTVGWTHAERSNDGLSVAWDLGGYHLYAFAARPTSGVFDLNSSYAGQNDIAYGGVSWTAKRGTWFPHTEVRLFGIAYRDDREASDGASGGAINEDLDVLTVGFSLVGVRPAGEGEADWLLWGAVQEGDWYDLDHRAFALLAEAGYHLTTLAAEPWLRAGVNLASGDGSATDGDHESFFNLLPTNHLYYGFADRLALANLVNAFVQLKLKPAPKMDLNVFLHHFLLFTDDDGRHFGTGAFNRNAFGYGVQASGGHRSVGTEVDVVLSYALHPRVSLQAGYSFLEGHALSNDLVDDDVRFAYFQVAARY
jgi:hypothetical protein